MFFCFLAGYIKEDYEDLYQDKTIYIHSHNKEKILNKIKNLEQEIYQKNINITSLKIENQKKNEQIKQLIEKTSDIENKFNLYRKSINPIKTIDGIKLKKFKIKNNENNYKFSMILTQINLQRSIISGSYSIKLEGIQENKKQALEAEKILIEGGNKFQFQFKYFQEIEGTLAIPKNFVIKKAIIKFKTGNNTKTKMINDVDFLI